MAAWCHLARAARTLGEGALVAVLGVLRKLRFADAARLQVRREPRVFGAVTAKERVSCQGGLGTR